MRTIIAGDSDLALRVASQLHAQGGLVGQVVDHLDQSWQAAGLLTTPAYRFAEGPRPLGTYDILLCIGFERRFDDEWLASPTLWPLNLHLGLLPHDRGVDPWLWAFDRQSDVGVTLHVMDSTSDGGDILAQRQVTPSAWGTPDDARGQLEDEAVDLIVSAWATVGSLQPRSQPPGGSYHRRSDTERLRAHLRGDL